MKNWFCWIPCYFAILVGVLSLSANRHNQMHKVSWEHWAVIGCKLFAYFWANTEHFYRVTFERLVSKCYMQDICEKRLQIQLLSNLCSVNAEFGKICTVSCPIVFVTVFRILLYEEQNSILSSVNLVPRALVTLVQRNGKTKTSGKMCLSSAFHWPLTERAQFHRKLVNNNFVPRFSILSRARWTCTLWVRSLRARTWRTKQSLLRHINQQHVRRCYKFSFVNNRNDMFGAYLRARTLRVLYCEGNRF